MVINERERILLNSDFDKYINRHSVIRIFAERTDYQKLGTQNEEG